MRDSKNTRDVINEITTKRILTLTNTQESLKLSSPSKLQKIQINLKEDLKQPVKKSKSAGFLQPWVCPDWVPKSIPNIPSNKFKLANLPTPIETWDFNTFTEANPDYELFIKRDDQTGAALTGNKVRKLEFLLADALKNGADTVITCGMATSNHCRSSAIACAKLGLECHLLLTNLGTDITFDSGNVALASASGAHLYQVDKEGVDEKMEELKQLLKKEKKNAYIIPRGGSNDISIWGYIAAWEEMETQEFFDEITDIVCVSGSGGTGLDLALANYWTGSKKKIHGIRTWGDSTYFYGHAKETLEDAGIFGVEPRDIIDVIDGHVGAGYGVSDESLRKFCIKSACETGIILERIYTGKAMFGLMKEVKSNPGRFQGNKIMFVHTGGIYGFLDRSMDADLGAFNPIKMNFFK